MLLDVPVELLLAILRNLPQADICTIVATSKDLNAVGRPLLSEFSGRGEPTKFESFCSYMLADAQRPLQLDFVDIDVEQLDFADIDVEQLNINDLHAQLFHNMNSNVNIRSSTENSRRIMEVLRLAKNLTRFSLTVSDAFYKDQSDFSEIIRSLPNLTYLHLTMSYVPTVDDPQHLLLSRLPARLHTISIYSSASTSEYLPSLADHATLRTLKIHNLGDTHVSLRRGDTTYRLPSLRTLQITSPYIQDLPALLAHFPHLEHLSMTANLHDYAAVGRPPYPPTLRLKSLVLLGYFWIRSDFVGQSARHEWNGLQVGWIHLQKYVPEMTDESSAPVWFRQMQVLRHWLKDGHPLGLVLWSRAFDNDFWARLGSVAPALRWMNVHWDPETQEQGAPYDTAGLLELVDGQCPIRIAYLEITIRSAITYQKPYGKRTTAAVRETGTLLRELEGRDERVCDRIVKTLPRYIPSLRYLTVSRTFGVESGSFFQWAIERTWRCFRVAGTRDMVEIPTWEGERVDAYCRDSVDVEAFDKFDERFVPIR